MQNDNPTSQSPFFLVVGLGNPGMVYAGTRHNVGFQIVDLFAERKGWVFRKDRSFSAGVSGGIVEGKHLILLRPETYMNSSGESVRSVVEYYKIPHTQVVVVCDDIYLPFGSLRMRTSGGTGGHNGLKSIELHLGTQIYMRLKVGVGNREHGDLADYVLSPFSVEEREKLPSVRSQAVHVLETWIFHGVVAAVQLASRSQEIKIGE